MGLLQNFSLVMQFSIKLIACLYSILLKHFLISQCFHTYDCLFSLDINELRSALH